MFRVSPVMMSAITTPISDNGNDIMMASGSRNDPNWMTRIRYINITARPSAAKMLPKTVA